MVSIIINLLYGRDPDVFLKQFVLLFLICIFQLLDVAVKFFHNDADGVVCAPYLSQIGVNLFNFSSDYTLAESKKLTAKSVTLLGNIPTRDVLAARTPEQVKNSVKAALDSVEDKRRIIMSSGQGMPTDFSTENIEACLSAVEYILSRFRQLRLLAIAARPR